jgi:hypothetical protein
MTSSQSEFPVKVTLIVLMTAVLGEGAFFGYRWWEDRSHWRTLGTKLPPASSPADATFLGEWWASAEHDHEITQAGYVRLANGDLWRFAFLSHHVLSDPDSKSLFDGPRGRFRVQGEYFCCEVQFPDTAQPKDSDAFLALLQQTHPTVESAP